MVLSKSIFLGLYRQLGSDISLLTCRSSTFDISDIIVRDTYNPNKGRRSILDLSTGMFKYFVDLLCQQICIDITSASKDIILRPIIIWLVQKRTMSEKTSMPGSQTVSHSIKYSQLAHSYCFN